MKTARRIEELLKWALALFYLGLGAARLWAGGPLAGYMAWKALMLVVIFVAAIAIDIDFRPVEPLLMALVQQGSSDETEIPLRRTMDRTRMFVQITYVPLFVTSWLGVTRGVPLL